MELQGMSYDHYYSRFALRQFAHKTNGAKKPNTVNVAIMDDMVGSASFGHTRHVNEICGKHGKLKMSWDMCDRLVNEGYRSNRRPPLLHPDSNKEKWI